MRAFVAVEVPSSPGETGRGSAPEHLTLHFLGEVAEERVPSLIRDLTPVGGTHAAFDLTLEGVGAFPSRERPRVVWAGATEGAAELIRLAHDIRDVLSPWGSGGREEAFVPHLTLFRVRSPGERRRAVELLEGTVAPPPPRRLRVREFVLKQSVLSSHGATHQTVATFALSAPPGGAP